MNVNEIPTASIYSLSRMDQVHVEYVSWWTCPYLRDVLAIDEQYLSGIVRRWLSENINIWSLLMNTSGLSPVVLVSSLPLEYDEIRRENEVEEIAQLLLLTIIQILTCHSFIHCQPGRVEWFPSSLMDVYAWCFRLVSASELISWKPRWLRC